MAQIDLSDMGLEERITALEGAGPGEAQAAAEAAQAAAEAAQAAAEAAQTAAEAAQTGAETAQGLAEAAQTAAEAAQGAAEAAQAAAEAAAAGVEAGLVYAALTAGAEAADNRVISVQVKDFGDANVLAITTLHCELFGVDMEPIASTAFTLTETGAGAELSTSGKARLLITTNALGVAEVTVHDVAGASGTTVLLKVSPVQAFGRAEYVSLAFDGA